MKINAYMIFLNY